ncbi:hypothetical protein CH063_08706, partial [Colletotrichum higginsianum]
GVQHGVEGRVAGEDRVEGARGRDVRDDGNVELGRWVGAECRAEPGGGGLAPDDGEDGVPCFEELGEDVLGDEAVCAGKEDVLGHLGECFCRAVRVSLPRFCFYGRYRDLERLRVPSEGLKYPSLHGECSLQGRGPTVTIPQRNSRNEARPPLSHSACKERGGPWLSEWATLIACLKRQTCLY